KLNNIRGKRNRSMRVGRQQGGMGKDPLSWLIYTSSLELTLLSGHRPCHSIMRPVDDRTSDLGQTRGRGRKYQIQDTKTQLSPMADPDSKVKFDNVTTTSAPG